MDKSYARYVGFASETITEAATQLVRMAPAITDFNGVPLTAEVETTVADLVQHYNAVTYASHDDEVALFPVAIGTKISRDLFRALEPRWKGQQSKSEWLRQVLIQIAAGPDPVAALRREVRVLVQEQLATAYVQEQLLYDLANGVQPTLPDTKALLARAQREKFARAAAVLDGPA